MKEGYGLPVDCCSYALPPVPRLHCPLVFSRLVYLSTFVCVSLSLALALCVWCTQPGGAGGGAGVSAGAGAGVGAGAGGLGRDSTPVLLFDASKRETHHAASGFKKLKRRLRTNFKVDL